MKSRLFYVGLGVLLGFLIFRYFEPPAAPPSTKTVVYDAPPLAPVPQVKKGAEVSVLANIAPVVPPPKVKREETIRFDERHIDLLDMMGTDARSLAYTDRESEGWKIYLTNVQSSFSEMGFKDGDFISDAALLDITDRDLRSRMIRILDTIQK